MKTIVVISLCLALVISDPKDASTVRVVSLSLFPPGSAFTIKTDRNVEISKHLEGFFDKWIVSQDKAIKNRVERSQTEGNNDTRRNQEVESTLFNVPTTTMSAVTEDYASKLRLAYLECVDETLIEVRRVIQFKAGSWEEHPMLSEWALCVLSKMNMMSKQGVYRYDTAMSRINNDGEFKMLRCGKRAIDNIKRVLMRTDHGRPRRRWRDELDKFLTEWESQAQDHNIWKEWGEIIVPLLWTTKKSNKSQ